MKLVDAIKLQGCLRLSLCTLYHGCQWTFCCMLWYAFFYMFFDCRFFFSVCKLFLLVSPLLKLDEWCSFLQAKNNLNSAVCLFEHAHWMLNIMRLRSTYDQNRYVDAWSKVVLACSFELEHGSKIWKQSLQKNIQTQILMNSRGNGLYYCGIFWNIPSFSFAVRNWLTLCIIEGHWESDW